MTKDPLEAISARRCAAFLREMAYFVRDCGWDLNAVALGFALASGVHRDHAAATAQALAQLYRGKRCRLKGRR